MCAEVGADPRKKAPDARYKLRVVEYSKAYGVRMVVEKFKVSAGRIFGNRGWESQEAELKSWHGGSEAIPGPRTEASNHAVEGRLRKWLLHHQTCRVFSHEAHADLQGEGADS